MDQQWFDEQVFDLESALKAQKANVTIPKIYPFNYQTQIDNQMAKYIDHTLLKPEASFQQIKIMIEEAKQYGFASICVNPCYVRPAARLLADSSTAVCTVIGFPFGANTAWSKAAETRDAVYNGADELDMVMSIGGLKNQDYAAVYQDIAMVKAAAGEHIVKVIIEISLLDKGEIVKACLLAKAAGADFVKTSTGFANGGAEVGAVELMRQTVGLECGVKAAGGIRDYQTALAMLNAGANRIGTSAGVRIVKMSAGENNAYES